MTTSPADLLRSADLRVTGPRTAVIEALASHPHAGADAVLAAVRRRRPISTQAVYDVLHVLVERGIVRSIQPAGSTTRYELRTGDNHHHVVCRACGSVTDVDCASGQAPCLDVPTDAGLSGFAIDEAEVTWWGVCPSCAATVPPDH